jgi:hypothetical protein
VYLVADIGRFAKSGLSPVPDVDGAPRTCVVPWVGVHRPYQKTVAVACDHECRPDLALALAGVLTRIRDECEHHRSDVCAGLRETSIVRKMGMGALHDGWWCDYVALGGADLRGIGVLLSASGALRGARDLRDARRTLDLASLVSLAASGS